MNVTEIAVRGSIASEDDLIASVHRALKRNLGKRRISHSEVRTLSTCEAKWDMSYGDKLAGSSLKPKYTADRLREGSAWGAAVAALHGYVGESYSHAMNAATDAMDDSLLDDAVRIWRKTGTFEVDAMRESSARLLRILAHYASTADLIPTYAPETRLEVALPSRVSLAGGKVRKSTRYDFEGYLDNLHRAPNDGVWIVDYKLRDSLSDFAAVENDRQWRRYCWAYREIHGVSPAGVKVIERLNGYPEPEADVKRNANGRLSKIQQCKPETYRVAVAHDVDLAREGELKPSLVPDLDESSEIIAKLTERHRPDHWQRVHTIILRESEIDEAGRELASAAHRIGMLERGDLYPIRNVSRSTCGGCDFRDACPNPDDRPVVDAFYSRDLPKRLRPPRTHDTEVAA